MKLLTKTIRSINELQSHILERSPSLLLASKTSTVLPYDSMRDWLKSEFPSDNRYLELVDLSQLPRKISCDNEGFMEILGPVTWQEMKAEASSRNFLVKTSPTEELAAVLSGVATSATGERCFGYGTLRSQLKEVSFMDYTGEIRTLKKENDFVNLDFSISEKQKIKKYDEYYKNYADFKNAPFPRFKKETDLLTGTEGQLGVITRAVIELTPNVENTYIFFTLPKWEENYDPHLEIFSLVQELRDKVFACELLDSNSLSVLPKDMIPKTDSDLIFLEMEEKSFEEVFEKLISKVSLVKEEDIFQMSAKKCRELRMAVPRATFEDNSKRGVVKMGTDVQVRPQDFKRLLDYYRTWTCKGIRFNLFGHFGDAHLHFNFLPTQSEVDKCQTLLNQLYLWVAEIKGSPFAEHGVGLIKKKYMNYFYESEHKEVFKILKMKFDPHNQFFPIGFMGVL